MCAWQVPVIDFEGLHAECRLDSVPLDGCLRLTYVRWFGHCRNVRRPVLCIQGAQGPCSYFSFFLHFEKE